MANASAFGFSGFDVGGSAMELGASYLSSKNQYKNDMNAWKTQMEYNSPENQMSRLKKAGLNPNLVYGSGSVVNNSGPIPSMQTPRISEGSFNSMAPNLGEFQNVKLAGLDIENKKFNNEYLNELKKNMIQTRIDKFSQEMAYNDLANPLRLRGIDLKNAQTDEATSGMYAKRLFDVHTFDDRAANVKTKLKDAEFSLNRKKRMLPGELDMQYLKNTGLKLSNIGRMSSNMKGMNELQYQQQFQEEKLRKLQLDNAVLEQVKLLKENMAKFSEETSKADLNLKHAKTASELRRNIFPMNRVNIGRPKK